MSDESAAIPRLVNRGQAWQLLVGGEPFLVLGGELSNSSSSSLAYMEPIWPALEALELNTVLAAVSWELVEPEEGNFDFSIVDGLVEGARRHGLRLALLWFGTWKNACSSYAPAWVKTDLARFPRAQCASGRKSDAISCLSEEACAADARAFAALMRRVRERDLAERTVIMVQVENETGLLGSSRDRSPAAEEAFRGAVPSELVRYLTEHREELAPPLASAWEEAGGRERGSWGEVFGRAADETFMAWHVARFVDRVAAAGKAEYPLPMFANAWLVQHEGQAPGAYPSGGPVAHMLDVWRAAAPHIDAFAPDIYLDDFSRVCEEYARPWNPLLIPEAHRDARAAANAFYAFGRGAVCFSPFGIDRVESGRLLAESYGLIESLAPLVLEGRARGAVVGFVQEGHEEQNFDLGGYRFSVRFDERSGDSPPGGGLLIARGDGEYVAAGLRFTMGFAPRSEERANVELLWAEEGRYRGGRWSPLRRLNGDETGAGHWVRCGARPEVVRFRLYQYA